MPFNQRERLMLALVIFCVAALFADRLVITPLSSLWSTRAKRITELEGSIRTGSDLVSRQSQLESRWREMVRESSSDGEAITENQVLGAVSAWAANSQITVTGVKPKWLTDEDQCKKLEVRVSLNGSLASAASFLYALEADPQTLKVEDFNLMARDDKGQTLNGEVRFTRLVLLEDAKKR